MKKTGILFVLALFFAGVCQGMNINNEQTGLSALTDDYTPSIPMDSLYQIGLPRTAKLGDCNGSLAVFLNDDKVSSDKDVYITSVYVFDLMSRKFSKLFTTTDPDEYGWYKPAGAESMKCTVNDIHSVYEARLFPYSSDKVVVSGCFDMRNVFSYIVDVNDKSVVLLPTNSGVLGFTMEEGFVVMRSYEYNTAVDEDGEILGGRHTVLSVFDENGEFFGAMDLEQKQ